jgi:hypothetical protein
MRPTYGLMPNPGIPTYSTFADQDLYIAFVVATRKLRASSDEGEQGKMRKPASQYRWSPP